MSRRLDIVHAGGTFHLDPFRAVGAGPLSQLDDTLPTAVSWAPCALSGFPYIE
jgi:hypothetical protein